MYIPTNLHKAIRSHSVFIQDRASKDIGSGVLIGLAGRYFVLSAAHVIKGDIDISLGLYTPETRFTILDVQIDSMQDVGYVELKPIEVNLLRCIESVPCYPKAKKKTDVSSKTPTFALCGFPRSTKVIKETRIEIPIFYQTVAVLAPEEWPSVFKSDLSSEHHIVIPYGEKRGVKFKDINNNPVSPIDPHGFSGCGLWWIDRATEDSDKPSYSLAGILRSYDKFYQVLIGVQSNILIDMILDRYKIELPQC